MTNTPRGYRLFKINTFEFINNIYSFLLTKIKSNVNTCNLLQQEASVAGKNQHIKRIYVFIYFERLLPFSLLLDVIYFNKKHQQQINGQHTKRIYAF